ncbi:MAG: hypothetical protein H6565_01855 [Lewinellaceae bacterium]|nr:hypothetical protein [Lewinellaceae bacterium]
MRRRLEETAIRLAHISRHDFRINAEALRELRASFSSSRPIWSRWKRKSTNSARAYRISGHRGALLQPAGLAKEALLLKVTSAKQPEPDEDSTSYDRRIANASYYLGLIESNQGNQDQAIAYFEKQTAADLQYRDFLTRIVTAESYILKTITAGRSRYIAEVQEPLAGNGAAGRAPEALSPEASRRAPLCCAPTLPCWSGKNNWHKRGEGMA